jgi:hypothetical protein
MAEGLPLLMDDWQAEAWHTQEIRGSRFRIATVHSMF